MDFPAQLLHWQFAWLSDCLIKVILVKRILCISVRNLVSQVKVSWEKIRITTEYMNGWTYAFVDVESGVCVFSCLWINTALKKVIGRRSRSLVTYISSGNGYPQWKWSSYVALTSLKQLVVFKYKWCLQGSKCVFWILGKWEMGKSWESGGGGQLVNQSAKYWQ